jgi:diguanylate cyclase (GGDEF)-like protein
VRVQAATDKLRVISLGTKLSLAIVGLIAAVTMTLGIKLADASRENLVASKRAAAVAFADLFAASIAPAVDFRDDESLQVQAGHFRSRPDAVYLAVWARDQAAPLVHTAAPGAVPPAKPTSETPSVSTLPDRVVVVRRIDGPVGTIGTAELAFSLAEENEAYRASRHRILVSVAALGAGLAAIILLLLRVWLTAPLRELTSAARRLQNGDRAAVRVRSNDEVGVLAAAFNDMAATIIDRERKVAEAYRELEELSLTDPLTGLRNRRFFAETVRQETARSLRRHSEPAGAKPRNRDVVVLIADLDFFKRINDTRGHAAGDDVLRETGRRLMSTVRQSDFVLRWGGEEFLIVARDTERADAAVIAGRILQAIGGATYEIGGGQKLRVTCSLGWAPYPWDGSSVTDEDLERVIQLADRALYHSKQTGRNRATGVQGVPGQPCDLHALPEGPLDALDGKLISLTVTLGPATEGSCAPGASRPA